MSSIVADSTARNFFGLIKRSHLVLASLAVVILAFPIVLSLNPQNTRNASVSSSSSKVAEKSQVTADRNRQILFMPNKGQLHENVEYYAAGAGHQLYLTKTGATYAFSKNENKELPEDKTSHAVKVNFSGANPDVTLVGQQEQSEKVNYFIGQDESKWKTDIATFSQVTYKNLYDGIDLIYTGGQAKIKYEFIVLPGANHKDIKLVYGGADSLNLDKKGNLIIATQIGKLKDEKPFVYQVIDGKKSSVAASFKINKNSVGFMVDSHNPTLPLHIDPAIYSTFLGGGQLDWAYGIKVDSSGAAYVTGWTKSADFPVSAGSFTGGSDAFVSKLDANGSSLVYSTFLGGTGTSVESDSGQELVLNALDEVFVVGMTSGGGFPTTPDAVQASYGGGTHDAFVTKLDSGGAIAYSTFLGGGGTDRGHSITIDSLENIYVTGHTNSSNFPTTVGAFRENMATEPSNPPWGDAFVSKIKNDGSGLDFSTYAGGNDFDSGWGIAVDTLGGVYFAGEARSRNFPVTGGAYQTVHGGGLDDGFVSKLKPDGSDLDYSTFLGGVGHDAIEDLVLDSSNYAYVTGEHHSSDFPVTSGAYDEVFGGGEDAFITKVLPDGSDLAYSTYLGGTAGTKGWSIALDAANNAYITGNTNSADLPTTPNALSLSLSGGGDAFVSKLNVTGSNLLYSTFLGGDSGGERGSGIAVDSVRDIYVAGYTGSFDFPTTSGAFDEDYDGAQNDAFVTKIGTADCFSPPAGLVSWWPGDGNAHDLQGSNPGTQMNWATFTNGRVDQAFRLDGTNDYIDIGSPDNLKVDGPHSVFAWVWLNENDEEDIVSKFAQIESGPYTREFLLMVWNGKVRGHTGSTEIDGARTVSPKSWHFIGQVWDGTTTTVYLNGTPDGSSPAPAPTPGSSKFLIGGRMHDGTTFRTSSDINGYVDEVQVFNRALTDQEILAEYNAGSAGKCKPAVCTDAPAEMVAWWPLDETTGTIAKNIIDDNDGAYQGVPFPSPITGKIAGALEFNGNNWARVPDSAALDIGTSDFSVDAWVKTTDISLPAKSIIDKRASGERGYHVYLWEGRLGVRLADGTPGGDNGGTNYNVPAQMSLSEDGQWHFVSVAVDRSSQITFMVDGEVHSTTTTAHTTSLTNSADLIIGGHTGVGVANPDDGWRFRGGIDELEIFDRALSIEEMQDIYEADSHGKCKDQLSGFQLDGGQNVDISVPQGSELFNVSTDFSAASPAGINFPFGTISYSVSVPQGESVTTTFEFANGLPDPLVLYKVDEVGKFTLIPQTYWTINGNRTALMLTLTDGGPFDLDGIINGVIIDPIGFGSLVPPSTGINISWFLLVAFLLISSGLMAIGGAVKLVSKNMELKKLAKT